MGIISWALKVNPFAKVEFNSGIKLVFDSTGLLKFPNFADHVGITGISTLKSELFFKLAVELLSTKSNDTEN